MIMIMIMIDHDHDINNQYIYCVHMRTPSRAKTGLYIYKSLIMHEISIDLELSSESRSRSTDIDRRILEYSGAAAGPRNRIDSEPV